MNRVLQAVSIAAAVLVLSACASSGGMASAPSDAGMHGERTLTDAEYVANVERVARDRGVDVQWVNPPQKRFAPRLASR